MSFLNVAHLNQMSKLKGFPVQLICRLDENIKTVEICEETVNPGQPKVRPHDFQLLKVLGKGGYGKV